MKDELEKIIKTSQSIGIHPEFAQGGGGNISVKINERIMLIKSSGYRLSELSESQGLTAVDYEKLKKFYSQSGENVFDVFQKDDSEFINFCVLEDISLSPRPSIETGFHSLLNKYVLHIHSAYVNIITCAKNAEQILKKIFSDSRFNLMWSEYKNPGLPLALNIKKLLDLGNFLPEVIALQNHGIIITCDELEKVLEINEEMNKKAKERLGISAPYPEIKIVKLEENRYKSQNDYLKNFIIRKWEYIKDFQNAILFPDQIVFCESIASDRIEPNKKIIIDKKTHSITYNGNFKEALTTEEILTAWAYIIDNIERMNLEPNFISDDDRQFVLRMESERYRKKLLEKS